MNQKPCYDNAPQRIRQPFMCLRCGRGFEEAELAAGKVPAHGSPGPLPENTGCPGIGEKPGLRVGHNKVTEFYT